MTLPSIYDWNTTQYSRRNACGLGLLARRAYNEATFSCDGSQVLVESTDEGLFLAFRGTEPHMMSDIVIDLLVALVPSRRDPGLVHAGFKIGLDNVWRDVRAVVGRKGNRPLWLTGHSLGGALAVLAASRLSGMGVFIHGVYTFGQPRVGNRRFSEVVDARLGDRLFRYVNHHDIVPHLPCHPPYRHSGCSRFFDATGRQVPLSREPDPPSPCDDDKFSDHDSARYIENLLRARPTGGVGVCISYICYDPYGQDVIGEHVELRNIDTRAARLKGWRLRDRFGHTFHFPDVVLEPEGSLKVWTGHPKRVDAGDLIWGCDHAVWNNTGDVATLMNEHGEVVNEFGYQSTPGGVAYA